MRQGLKLAGEEPLSSWPRKTDLGAGSPSRGGRGLPREGCRSLLGRARVFRLSPCPSRPLSLSLSVSPLAVHRSIYKDMIYFLQKKRMLTEKQLKLKVLEADGPRPF